MRKTKTGKADKKVMDVIARNYSKLKELCGYCDYGLYCSKSYEDIFQDTVLYISQDEQAAMLSFDKELIEYFCYRFKMIEYQAINDNKTLKENSYADNKQAQKESD